jgi:hypothetical protein
MIDTYPSLTQRQNSEKSNTHETHVSIVSSVAEHEAMAYEADWFPATCFYP